MSKKASFPFGQKIVWTPKKQWIEQSNLFHFMNQYDIKTFEVLFQRSIEDIAWFWDAVLKDLDIQFYEPYTKIVDFTHAPQFPRWCQDGKMNIIHNCLDKWQTDKLKNKTALIWEHEEGTTGNLSYAELNRQVSQCAQALRQLEIKKGDVVGLYMPMIPEIAVAFLAIIKIGAIILPLFSGYGPAAIASRLIDAKAKAVFTSDGAIRRGKKVNMKQNMDEALKQASTVKFVIVFERAEIEELNWQPHRDYWWNDIINNQSTLSNTEHTDAEDLAMLIYTSGTTGNPKGAVHTHCGFPIKAAQDMFHCMDLQRENTIYWMTDMGWMMGPWEVFGSLLIGATMVFYDGAPDYPKHDRIWQQVNKHHITHLGVSPTLIRSLKSRGENQFQNHNLNCLRMIGSTGSPWDPESWLWLFEKVLHRQKPILNYSGGTEISGGILCGNFFKPLKPCAFSGPIPGMDADVVDENGNSLRGGVGELIIRQPWIGMTRGFWQNNERYVETYWNRFENIWLHGDFAAIDEDDLWYILGRSDDTIKVAGKRIGPAEVESILNIHKEVTESAVIGVPDELKGEEIVAFCVLRTETKPTDKLRAELTELITNELGKPLKPRDIKFTRMLPKTRNAKVMHRIIRDAYLNRKMSDLSSLENVAAIDAIKHAV